MPKKPSKPRIPRGVPRRKDRKLNTLARNTILTATLGLPLPQHRGTGEQAVVADNIEATSRQLVVADMILAGHTHAQIASELGVSIMSVQHDVMRVIEVWQAYQLERVDQWVSVELEKLAKLERDAWSSYHASKVPRQKNGKPIRDGIPGPGDWHYLDMVLKVNESRRKLLGLNAPERMVQENFHYVDLSIEERTERVADLLEAARARRARVVDVQGTQARRPDGDGPGGVDPDSLPDSGDEGPPPSA